MVRRVAAIVSRNSQSNGGLSSSSSPAWPLSSQIAAPSKSESGPEGATRRVRMCKQTRSSHWSARPHRLTSHIPHPTSRIPIPIFPCTPNLTLHHLILPLYALPIHTSMLRHRIYPHAPSFPHLVSSTPLSSIDHRCQSAGYGVPTLSCQLTGPLSKWASCARVRSSGPRQELVSPLLRPTTMRTATPLTRRDVASNVRPTPSPFLPS